MFSRTLSGIPSFKSIISSLCVLVYLSLVISFAKATVPGQTAGELTVNANGSTVYNIPLITPPGTAGMQPSLTISYNSQGSNGLLGTGFSLGGLSVITRCPPTIAIDGFDVQEDRFCLDGQRLISINGAYGADGTEYRTEIDSFTRVVSFGDTSGQGNTPERFMAYTRTGQRIEYGFTADSRVLPEGESNARLWAMNRITDVSDNYLTVTYSQDTVNGTYKPLQMDYTGNQAAGLSPYARVEFEYEARPDNAATYSRDSVIRYTERLANIKTFTDNQLVRDYQLTYENQGAANRSRVTRVTECDGSNNPQCFRPIEFTWNGETINFTNADYGLVRTAEGPLTYYEGDFNGDGKTDLLQREYITTGNFYRWYLQVSTGDGFTEVDFGAWGGRAIARPGSLGGADARVVTGDFNGDGQTDLFYEDISHFREGRTYFIVYFTSAGLQPIEVNPIQIANTIPRDFFPGDFNGDGRTDLLFAVLTNSGTASSTAPLDPDWSIAYSTGVSFESVPLGRFGVNARSANYQVGDFNGDGLMDILILNVNIPNTLSGTDSIELPINWFLLASNGSGGLTPHNLGTWGTAVHRIIGGRRTDFPEIDLADFNSDGLTDVLFRNTATLNPTNRNGWYLRLSKGTDFETINTGITAIPHESARAGDFLYFGDYNGDGLVDVLYHEVDDNNTPNPPIHWYLQLSTGRGFSTVDLGQRFNAIERIGSIILNTPTSPFINLLPAGSGGVTGFGGRSNLPRIQPSTPTTQQPSRGVFIPHIFFPGDYNNDGISDLVFARAANNQGIWTINRFSPAQVIPDQVNRITNSLGQQTAITMKPLSDETVHTRGNDSVFPVFDVVSPMYVVRSIKTDADFVLNGVSTPNQREVQYHYSGARGSRFRGFLGFESMEVLDMESHIMTTTTYSQEHPFIGMMLHSEQVHTNGTDVDTDDAKLSEVDTVLNSLRTHDGVETVRSNNPDELSHPGVLFPFVETMTARAYDIGELTTTTETNTTYDDFGNALTMTVDTTCHDVACAGETHSMFTENTYKPADEVNWIIDRLERAEVTRTLPDNASETRVSTFAYQPNGLLAEEIIEPDTVSLRLKRTHTYDAYGNRKKTRTVGGFATDGTAILPRTDEVLYDFERGQFPFAVTNSELHSERPSYDARFGVIQSSVDANRLTTSWDYDSFGRLLRETRPDNTTTTITREWCDGFLGEVGNANCPVGGALVQTTEVTGEPRSIEYLDRLGRSIRTETVGFDGRPVYTDTEYNALGQVAATSRPYYANETSHWATAEYDEVGRVVRTTSVDPDAAGDGVIENRTEYQGLSVTSINDEGQRTTRTTNAIGELIATQDNLENVATYTYDPFSNLVTLTDSEGNVTRNEYDIRGRKIWMDDPDMGIWTYRYNVADELISQTDAKGQTVTMRYDRLGRLVERIEPEGTTTWRYDFLSGSIFTAASQHTVGRLLSVSSPEGKTERYQYSADIGRLEITTTDIIGNPSYEQAQSYDAAGRIDTITYPERAHDNGRLKVQYHYNEHGYLTSISNAEDASEVFYEMQATTAEGQLQRERFGNGVQTQYGFTPETGFLNRIKTDSALGTNIQDTGYRLDALGRLTYRTDHLQNDTEERFGYDGLNRMTHSELNGQRIDYTYDDLGNYLSRSESSRLMLSHLYNGSRPHASSTTVCLDERFIFHNIPYDENGNATQTINCGTNETRDITWTSYNKPRSIAQGTRQVAFAYGADRELVQQTASKGGQLVIHNYVNTVFEVVSDNDSTTYTHYLRAGGQTIGFYNVIDERFNNSLDRSELRYLHRDHLGSITAITDEAGVLVERLSYTPHGKRRPPNLQEAAAQADIVGVETDRSYTGHRYLDEVGLIHMGGRVYDPDAGRFMSPDPFIQAPDNQQSFNRYSYVFNNPMVFTDPSGFIAIPGITIGIINGFFGAFGSFGDFGDRNTPVNDPIDTLVGSVLGDIPLAGDTFNAGIFNDINTRLGNTTLNFNNTITGNAATGSNGFGLFSSGSFTSQTDIAASVLGRFSVDDAPNMALDFGGGKFDAPNANNSLATGYLGVTESVFDRLDRTRTFKQLFDSFDSNSDLGLLTRIIFAEGGVDFREPGALQAIGSVVLNRVDATGAGVGFPNTISEVIFDEGQFDGATSDNFRNAANPLSLTLLDRRAFFASFNVAQQLLNGTLFDITNRSLFFFSGSDPNVGPDSFFQNRIDSGRFIFQGTFGGTNFFSDSDARFR